LLSVYKKHAINNNLTIVSVSESNKQMEIIVSGKEPKKFFYKESGTHRIQRIPPTENKGRVHTSILNVVILEKQEEKEIKLNEKDLVYSYYKASGAGGQHRNKTMSGVRVQYQGITVECCDTRDQVKNKKLAILRLQERLRLRQDKEEECKIVEKINMQNPQKGKRGDFGRNYNFPRDEIKQDGEKYSLSKFLRGNLSDIYKERI
jgi:peptide chain release factor 1